MSRVQHNHIYNMVNFHPNLLHFMIDCSSVLPECSERSTATLVDNLVLI